MELRSNQIQPVKIGIDFFNQKKADPSIIVAPTAFGKSIVIAKIAEAVEDKLLILQPSKELLEQNFAKYIALGGYATIYSASFGQKKISNVTYATIGSIQSIGGVFKEMGFTKMIIDETHLYPRNSDSMLGRFLKSSGITHVLGLTATPLKLQTNMDRTGRSFSKLVMLTSRSKKGQFFKDIIYVSQVEEMVNLGYWSKLEYEQYEMDEDRLVYNSTKAEFTEESIKAMYEANNTEKRVIKRIEQLDDRKSIIVFVPSVDRAISLAERTPNAVAIYGNMNSKDRNVAVTDFKKGKIRVVFNVNVLSVGFDHPGLDCIICARSTASMAWYYQALGRGTRICDGKQDCLIVDFSGNVKRFGKIEQLRFVKEGIWKLYGENGNLLTGVPIHEIGIHNEKTENDVSEIIMSFGRHKGKPVHKLPKEYMEWALKDITWNEYNKKIKKAMISALENLKKESINPKVGVTNE